MATSNGWPTSYLTGVASTNDDLHPAHDYVESVTKIPSSAFEKDLIAILLVAEGASEKNKLLFKYEDQTDDKEKDNTNSPFAAYSVIIHMEFDPPNISDTDSARRTFRSFQSDTIAALTDPGYNFYGSNFEVQVDDVYFVGHTLAAPDVEKENHLKSFGVYFALRAITKPSVLLSYQTLSKCIGTAIRWEEQRVKYLTQEYNAMSACLQPTLHEHQDEMKPEERKERENEIDMAYKQMLDKSSLAQTLKQIYIDLQMAGEVNIMLNNWVRVSCCLPHRSVPINCSLSQDKVFYILTNAERFFKPYYGLLLLSDQSSLQSSLPLDSSSTLNTLLKHLRSSYTMARLSIETSIPLTQIYRLAAHLLYWGRVKIIFPIVDDNYYVIAPDADLSKNSSLSKLYAQTFQHSTVCYTTLQEALAEYSDSIPFHLHGVQCETDHELRERLRCVEWLLKHRLIVQLHYYYYLLIKDDRNEHLDEFKRSRHPKPRVTHRLTSEIPVSSLSHGSPLSSYSTISLYNDQMIDQSNNSNSNLQDDVFPTTILPLRYLFQIEQALPDETNDYRQRVATAINNSNENDVNQFLKIAKYLNGEHHLEEIIYLESLTRTQILSTIESFQHIVIKALHVDPNLVLQI